MEKGPKNRLELMARVYDDNEKKLNKLNQFNTNSSSTLYGPKNPNDLVKLMNTLKKSEANLTKYSRHLLESTTYMSVDVSLMRGYDYSQTELNTIESSTNRLIILLYHDKKKIAVVVRCHKHGENDLQVIVNSRDQLESIGVGTDFVEFLQDKFSATQVQNIAEMGQETSKLAPNSNKVQPATPNLCLRNGKVRGTAVAEQVVWHNDYNKQIEMILWGDAREYPLKFPSKQNEEVVTKAWYVFWSAKAQPLRQKQCCYCSMTIPLYAGMDMLHKTITCPTLGLQCANPSSRDNIEFLFRPRISRDPLTAYVLSELKIKEGNSKGTDVTRVPGNTRGMVVAVVGTDEECSCCGEDCKATYALIGGSRINGFVDKCDICSYFGCSKCVTEWNANGYSMRCNKCKNAYCCSECDGFLMGGKSRCFECEKLFCDGCFERNHPSNKGHAVCRRCTTKKIHNCGCSTCKGALKGEIHLNWAECQSCSKFYTTGCFNSGYYKCGNKLCLKYLPKATGACGFCGSSENILKRSPESEDEAFTADSHWLGKSGRERWHTVFKTKSVDGKNRCRKTIPDNKPCYPWWDNTDVAVAEDKSEHHVYQRMMTLAIYITCKNTELQKNGKYTAPMITKPTRYSDFNFAVIRRVVQDYRSIIEFLGHLTEALGIAAAQMVDNRRSSAVTHWMNASTCTRLQKLEPTNEQLDKLGPSFDRYKLLCGSKLPVKTQEDAEASSQPVKTQEDAEASSQPPREFVQPESFCSIDNIGAFRSRGRRVKKNVCTGDGTMIVYLKETYVNKGVGYCPLDEDHCRNYEEVTYRIEDGGNDTLKVFNSDQMKYRPEKNVVATNRTDLCDFCRRLVCYPSLELVESLCGDEYRSICLQCKTDYMCKECGCQPRVTFDANGEHTEDESKKCKSCKELANESKPAANELANESKPAAKELANESKPAAKSEKRKRKRTTNQDTRPPAKLSPVVYAVPFVEVIAKSRVREVIKYLKDEREIFVDAVNRKLTVENAGNDLLRTLLSTDDTTQTCFAPTGVVSFPDEQKKLYNESTLE